MLLRFCDAGIIELLLVIASNSSEPDSAEWNVVVLEVLYYLLQGVPVKDIFECDLKGKVSMICMVWMRRVRTKALYLRTKARVWFLTRCLHYYVLRQRGNVP